MKITNDPAVILIPNSVDKKILPWKKTKCNTCAKVGHHPLSIVKNNKIIEFCNKKCYNKFVSKNKLAVKYLYLRK